MRKKVFDLTRWALTVAFCCSVIPTTPVLADNTATCVARMSSYVTELDELFSFSTWIEAFDKLNSRYFPFMDCDTDPLLVETTKSRFSEGLPITRDRSGTWSASQARSLKLVSPIARISADQKITTLPRLVSSTLPAFGP